MVFSEVEEGSEGNGHKGEVTGSYLSVMGTSTNVDDIRCNTDDTLDDRETGTRDETEDVTSRGTDRVLIGCSPNATWQRVDQGGGLDTSWIVRNDPNLTWWRVGRVRRCIFDLTQQSVDWVQGH